MTHAAEPDAERVLPERLVALLTGHLDVGMAPEQLTATMTFESLGMDSLSLMELVVAAEQEFGIVLAEGELDLFPASTLGDAARAFEHAA
ncbi:acyl carrier protein [Streptomyces diastatochromogenes]|uniref:Acyl carrier protein n=1 Tax=Streptomyces diastatochromogenes TaxID=42236 RepID=A0A233S7F3_STRDA|nr:acyl carrier protein [Streptomyces diastatochromogenes]MCZ0990615.1 acyl carrier protein [Streptomyces diastatochromogenes]OXY91618.1 acyl carrier protein [Streptomyces diastatochromogenes]